MLTNGKYFMNAINNAHNMHIINDKCLCVGYVRLRTSD